MKIESKITITGLAEELNKIYQEMFDLAMRHEQVNKIDSLLLVNQQPDRMCYDIKSLINEILVAYHSRLKDLFKEYTETGEVKE